MPLNPAMKTSAAGRKFIEQWEESGVAKLHPYDDGTGTLTIGFGHTSAAGPPPVTPGLIIDEAEADLILSNDLRFVEADVNRFVNVPLAQPQFDVLVSFHFNTGGLGRSTLLKRLNAGDYAAVPGELMKWVRGGGDVMQGLVNRRRAEGAVWRSAGAPQPQTVPVPQPQPVPPQPAEHQSWWGRAWTWLEETHTW